MYRYRDERKWHRASVCRKQPIYAGGNSSCAFVQHPGNLQWYRWYCNSGVQYYCDRRANPHDYGGCCTFGIDVYFRRCK